MHLKCGYFVLYTQIYRQTERNERFLAQNFCWRIWLESVAQESNPNINVCSITLVVFVLLPIKGSKLSHNQRSETII